MKYLERNAEALVKSYLKDFPVVGITGPRQSGKSTMLNHLLRNKYRYVTFDDFHIAEQFNTDPVGFMNEYSNKIVFDEVQNVPDIFTHIKFAVDKDRHNYGKFVLTGSSQFAFLKGVSESLAGRIGLLALLPLEFTEMPITRRKKSVALGSYPELVLKNYTRSNNWYSSYLDTYLTRDIRTLREIGDMRDFRRCITLLAARAGQILNMSDLSRDIGVTVATIKKWISVLEASYIVFLLPPYYKNLGKRIIKSPKVFFYDTGLVSYLLGIENLSMFEQHQQYGNLFENYIVSEIAKKEIHRNTHAELFYYRTNHGVEIDLFIDRRSSVEYVEVKSAKKYQSEMVNSILTVRKNNEKATVLYRGKTIAHPSNIEIKNYADYFMER